MRRAKDSRATNLDNLANAAMMASQVERAGLHNVTAGKGSAKTSTAKTGNRRPKKKARSGSPSDGAASGSPRGAVSDSPARTISDDGVLGPQSSVGHPQQHQPAVVSEPAVTSRLHANPMPDQEAANNSWQTAAPDNAAAAAHPHAGASELYEDPVAAAIKNATHAITTDGALQASGDAGLHGVSQHIVVPLQTAHTDGPQAGSPEGHALSQQQIQLAYQNPAGQLTFEDQSQCMNYPVQADGTVTITSSHATPDGATVLVRQPEGLLIVRDPSTGKEQYLGKLLGNSKQTSLILQAANFLEPCSGSQ